jgi:hypothetical protein
MRLYVKHPLQELHIPVKLFGPMYAAWKISTDFKLAIANFGLQRDGPNFHIDFRGSVDNIFEKRGKWLDFIWWLNIYITKNIILFDKECCEGKGNITQRFEVHVSLPLFIQ